MLIGAIQTADALADRRLADRAERARAGATAAISALSAKGVTARLVGSLANQDFGQTSDVDLLVTDCPRSLKYAIESIVEDCLPGFSFDVLYLDELSSERARLFDKVVHG